MGARQSMTMRTTVERDTGAVENTWGHNDPAWTVHLDVLPCRMWVAVETDVTDDLRTARSEDRRAMVPSGTDITPGDRLRQVTDRLGQVLFDGPMHVATVVRRPGHLELLVERTS